MGSGFKVDKTNDDLEQRYVREGDPYNISFESNHIAWTGSSTSGGMNVGRYNSLNGKALYVKSLTFGASRRAQGRSIFSQIQVGSYPITYNSFWFGGDAGPVTIEVKSLIKPNRTQPDLNILSVFEADPRTTIALAQNGSNFLATAKATANTTITGGLYSNTITITNNTGSPTSGTITVTDRLPSGCRFVTGTGAGWTVSESGGIITATSTTVLANNGTSTITITYAPVITTCFTAAGSAYWVDMDTDYNAPYIMPVCGTSISFGTGSSTSEGMYTWLFRNWLRETKNYRIRRINRAISGSTSTHHESLRVLEGRYDFDKTKGVFIYEHGVNDVSQGLSTAISKANLLAMIRHKQRLYPDMTMLVLAPFPVSTAQEANLAILSPALDTTVADVNDPKVIYVSTTRTCFDPVTDTTDGIHPTETGNAKIATAIINFCNSNNIQFMS